MVPCCTDAIADAGEVGVREVVLRLLGREMLVFVAVSYGQRKRACDVV